VEVQVSLKPLSVLVVLLRIGPIGGVGLFLRREGGRAGGNGGSSGGGGGRGGGREGG